MGELFIASYLLLLLHRRGRHYILPPLFRPVYISSVSHTLGGARPAELLCMSKVGTVCWYNKHYTLYIHGPINSSPLPRLRALGTEMIHPGFLAGSSQVKLVINPVVVDWGGDTPPHILSQSVTRPSRIQRSSSDYSRHIAGEIPPKILNLPRKF